MKKKIIVLFLFIVISGFGKEKDLSKIRVLFSSNIERDISFSNFSSYSYRAMKISMDVDLLGEFLENYRKKIRFVKFKEGKEKEIAAVLKKSSFQIKSSEKIYYSYDKSFVYYPFKVDNRIYVLKSVVNENKLRYSLWYYTENTGFQKLKQIDYDYINSYENNMVGVRIKKFPRYYILNKDFKRMKRFEHKGLIFPKDIVKKGNRIYFHKKRYKRGEPAVEIMERGEIKYYFNKTQSSKDELEDVAVMDDTVFGMGEDCFYISFTYPEDNFIRIYKYTDTGKIFEIKVNIEDEYFGVPKYWNNLVRFQRRTIYDIASVNGIYEGKKYLYIATGRNKIEKGIDTNLRDYLYILSRDGRYYYGRIKLGYGTPVYYDRDTGWFYSVKLKAYPVKEIWRWKIKFINS